MIVVKVRLIDKGTVVREGTAEAESLEELQAELSEAAESLVPGQWLDVTDPETGGTIPELSVPTVPLAQ